MTVTEQILALFEARGGEEYFGEAVSQLEHALQCGTLAQEARAPAELVVASLLHDIGHLLHEEGEDAAQRGLDTRHEEDGDRWLATRFPPSVTEPVRLHVAAKRYLCAREAEYLLALSPASKLSLELQGGPMSEDEASEFEANPFYAEAVRLRRWDDQAKVVDLKTPDMASFAVLIDEVLS